MEIEFNRNYDNKLILIQGGTLCFWGDWFGRPMDNFHEVVSSLFDETNNIFILSFREGEKCIIYQPNGIVSTNKQFYINDADKVIFEWYHYGREKIAENKLSIEYIKAENGTIIKKTVNGIKKFNPEKKYAFNIC
jgi:hypothetical protein